MESVEAVARARTFRAHPMTPGRSIALGMFGASLGVLMTVAAYAQSDDPAADELKTTLVGGVVSQIEAVGGFGGGNVAVSIGPDGVLLVDTMTKGIAPKLKAELARLSTRPVRLVVNTHFHLDHAGGNVGFGESATIVAQENVRNRLAAARMPPAGLPTVTYADGPITLHFNGENIRLMHCSAAHTDGDTIVVFENSKVVHLGDLYFSGMFPAVYREGGGDWKGLIACLDRVMPNLPEDAAVIAGHGPSSHMRELRAYVAMLKETTSIVESHLRAGETATQMNAANVLVKYDALGSGGAQSTSQYVEMLVKLLSPPRDERSK